jgi:hypothetical protein
MSKGKLTDEQYQYVLSLNERYHSQKRDLADTVILLDGLESKKQRLIAESNITSEDLRKFQEEMYNQYGEIKINMQTGEYD